MQTWIDECVFLCTYWHPLNLQKNMTHNPGDVCINILNRGILSNSPADLLLNLFLLNKWICLIFTRSVLLRCMNQIYTWSLVFFGSLPLHKYYLYAPTRCCFLLCWLALDTQGSFYWFLEGLHSGFLSSVESHFQERAFYLSFLEHSNFCDLLVTLKS